MTMLCKQVVPQWGLHAEIAARFHSPLYRTQVLQRQRVGDEMRPAVGRLQDQGSQIEGRGSAAPVSVSRVSRVSEGLLA